MRLHLRRSRGGRASPCYRPGTNWFNPVSRFCPGGVYDSNGAIIAAVVAEAGGEAAFGAVGDNQSALERAGAPRSLRATWWCSAAAHRRAPGTYRTAVVSRLGSPGILVHGVVFRFSANRFVCCIEKPLIVLPIPTSAIFTFHAFVAPLIRARAGLPSKPRTRLLRGCQCAYRPELGREEFVLVSLIGADEGLVAFPDRKGSGAGDGVLAGRRIFAIDALASALDADSCNEVTLIGKSERAPDLVIMGSHDIALDVVVGVLAERMRAHYRCWQPRRSEVRQAAANAILRLYISSMLRPVSTTSIRLATGLALVPGWRRMVGFVFRHGDARFEGRSAEAAPVRFGRSRHLDGQPQCRFRHARVDRQPSARREAFRLCQSAAPQRRGRHDCPASRRLGVIAPVAKLYGLGFLPIAPEHYDFLLVEARRQRPAVQAFIAALQDETTRDRIRALGMEPAAQ